MRQSTPFHSLLRTANLIACFSLSVSTTFLALHKLEYPLTGIDDANIYFVYARNLANGHGFVYNIGGERVEGFTSLLWTVISALAFKIFAHPELILLSINLLLVSFGIACALQYLQHVLAERGGSPSRCVFWSAAYLLLIFSSPRYIVWNTITLMENALWSTLLLVTTVFVLDNHSSLRTLNIQLILLSILLLVTRPESILWVPVFTLVLFTRQASQENAARALKNLWPSILGILLAFSLLTLFRLYYFGYPLPNTFYAKVSPSLAYDLEQGTLYLIRYFMSDPIAGLSMILIFLACLVSLLRPAPRHRGFFLPFLAATGLFVPVLTGGDHFGSFRFYQNVYPLTLLAAILFFQQSFSNGLGRMESWRIKPWGRMLLVAGLALLFLAIVVPSQFRAWSRFVPEIQTEFTVAEYERTNGAFIQRLFSPLQHLPSIGVIASGGIKYSYSGAIIDLLGLNNTTMAHNRGDRKGYKNHAAFEVRTFYELEPDIVWPVLVNHEWTYDESELRARWENIEGFKGLFNDPHFLDLYEYAKVGREPQSPSDLALVAWFKKNFIRSLIARPDFWVEEYHYSP